MIEKQEFYHGAALIRAVDDIRCRSIKKLELGFVVNDNVFVYLKYTTKSRSPWRFQFGQDEILYLNTTAMSHVAVIIALICGGDGVCGLNWKQVFSLMGYTAGWVSCKRNFNEQYAVAGSCEKMKGKVTLQQWPNLIFNQ